MTVLVYKSRATIGDLAVGECTVHPASGSAAAVWWLLWFRALRDDDGQPARFCVPIRLGMCDPAGPGGKTWGVTCPAGSAHIPAPRTKNWMVNPSINVTVGGDAHFGAHPLRSLWHQTPEILNVPEDEPWTTGAAP